MAEVPEAVGIGEFQAGGGARDFIVYGLGSCVAVVLHDASAGVGGLAHVLLPGPRPPSDRREGLPAKYADEACTSLAKALVALGADRRRLKAGLVGGARLFASETPLEEGVGARNVQGALCVLDRLGIPIRWQETGGEAGRTVRFGLPGGALAVRTLREGWRDVPSQDGA